MLSVIALVLLGSAPVFTVHLSGFLMKLVCLPDVGQYLQKMVSKWDKINTQSLIFFLCIKDNNKNIQESNSDKNEYGRAYLQT